MKLHDHVGLASFTTLGVGGPGRHLVDIASEAEAIEALQWAAARALPVLVLGGGSNLLVADRGFPGLVLRMGIRGIRAVSQAGDVLVEAGAGEPWDDLVAHAVVQGWAGLECLSGIPGLVGATPVQNVGAYGQEVSESIVEVRALERGTGAVVTLNRAACQFGYRDSVFKRAYKDRLVVVSVRFALRPGGEPSMRYAELGNALARHPSPSLIEVRNAVLHLRRSKSMVLDEADENRRSAGSFFMNPTVSKETAAEVRARVAAAGVLAAGESMPAYAAPQGQLKLSAAWLIERAGLGKGTGAGPVGLSTRHTLAIVNRGHARADQVVTFAQDIRARVLERFGVALQAEVSMVGFTADEIEGL